VIVIASPVNSPVEALPDAPNVPILNVASIPVGTTINPEAPQVS
jgi:hypothetical protein